MQREQLKGLAALNGYQVAGLAFLASAAAAIATLVVLRRTILRRPATAPGAAAPSGVPNHFSEDLTIPGFTATGEQIAEQDANEGHSPEGV
jgi:hypothetical protein